MLLASLIRIIQVETLRSKFPKVINALYVAEQIHEKDLSVLSMPTYRYTHTHTKSLENIALVSINTTCTYSLILLGYLWILSRSDTTCMTIRKWNPNAHTSPRSSIHPGSISRSDAAPRVLTKSLYIVFFSGRNHYILLARSAHDYC